jgi:glycerol uptake facilitator-like aquaporin
MINKRKNSFLYNNSLSITFLLLAVITIVAQVLTGLWQYNNFLNEHNQNYVGILQYLTSGHFIEATFENWESEFLQMALFVLFTVFLRQKGSSESKQLSGKEDVDKQPKKHPNTPWPVRKGGVFLSVYKHSLSLSLMLLFIVSFLLHWYGSNKDFNEQQILEGKSTETMITYISNSRFWFESFQNWQSEFLSVFAIIFLSIYLREIGSPQSKPVDSPYSETGE